MGESTSPPNSPPISSPNSSPNSSPTESAGEERIACGSCGLQPAADERAEARLAWVRGWENKRVVWTCVPCSRTNIRGIEGKLDSDWW